MACRAKWLPGPDQIGAAERLYARMRYWRVGDAAVAALAEEFPDFSEQTCLLKVAAVNQLFYTNVLAVGRMGEHIAGVMNSDPKPVNGVELVVQIAAMPGPNGQPPPRDHTSFASKFAHFFIDAEAHPIYDKYAAATVKHVLLGSTATTSTTRSYSDYVSLLRQLRDRAGLSCPTRRLDHWLWLAGLYRHWLKKPEDRINREARSLFEDADDETKTDLDLLWPERSETTANRS